MSDCIFCKIVSKEINSDIVFESKNIVAFRDINPQAPTHLLLIPRKHIPMIAETGKEDKDLLGELILTARDIAEQENIAKSGYRLVFNNGDHGGQDVYHVHLHLLGGRPLQWPPG